LEIKGGTEEIKTINLSRDVDIPDTKALVEREKGEKGRQKFSWFTRLCPKEKEFSGGD